MNVKKETGITLMIGKTRRSVLRVRGVAVMWLRP